MVFCFIFKVGVIAFAIDWLHRRAHGQNCSTELDRRIEDAKRNVEEMQPRVREWFHRVWCSPTPDHLPPQWRRFRFHRRPDPSFPPEVTELPDKRRLSVEIDVPGIRKEDLNVSVVDEERTVVVKGRAEARSEDGKRERVVEARIPLPATADMAGVKASYEDGVLRVEAAKRDYEGRKIPVS
ncbi:hypothetical protein HDU96_005475 [Phlyctochytrium bullatum]|nr:hypothetical protein HDU96_005475 [Phlyctochytrium bullatum]